MSACVSYKKNNPKIIFIPMSIRKEVSPQNQIAIKEQKTDSNHTVVF